MNGSQRGVHSKQMDRQSRHFCSGSSASKWYHKVTYGGRATRSATRASRSKDEELQKIIRGVSEDTVPDDREEEILLGVVTTLLTKVSSQTLLHNSQSALINNPSLGLYVFLDPRSLLFLRSRTELYPLCNDRHLGSAPFRFLHHDGKFETKVS